MRKTEQTAALAEEILKERGIVKYSLNTAESTTQELNTANGDFSLYRTVFGDSFSVTVYEDGRSGSASGNDISREGLTATIEAAIAAERSAEADPAHDFAPDQGYCIYHDGCPEPDMDRFFERFKELLSDVKTEYPRINITQGIGEHTKTESLYKNSNGTCVNRTLGNYSLAIEFVAIEDNRSTNLDYADISFTDLDSRFLDLGSFRRHLADCEASLHLTAIRDKFTGTVIFTPECFAQFISATLENYVDNLPILDGTSLWLDKLNTKVASEALTIAFNPRDSRIVGGERVTGDGYLAEDIRVIENGILKQFILSLYTANKTGRPVTKNSGASLVIEPGIESLEKLIASVDRGLIVGGFSGGEPGRNGEFSGVAKNSFYIEKGKIVGPVTETMINGNLGSALLNIRGLSSEVLADGVIVAPYAAVDGIVISGN